MWLGRMTQNQKATKVISNITSEIKKKILLEKERQEASNVMFILHEDLFMLQKRYILYSLKMLYGKKS